MESLTLNSTSADLFGSGSVTMSKLKVYSLGIVAENKLLDSPYIKVTPVEDMAFVDGELAGYEEEYQASGTDRSDSSYDINLKNTVQIKAKWMPLGSPNRFTSPDVRRGEYVMIYQFGDADQYYWVTMKDDLSLRKLETVIYAFSGTRDEDAKPSKDNCYFLEISTHRKLVHFHTSKEDEEPYCYDVQICTEKGYVIIKDDIENIITIDSKEHRIELINTDKCHQDMHKKDWTVTVPGNTLIQTTGNTTITTKGNTLVQTKGNTTVETDGNTKVTTKGNTDINTSGNTGIKTSGSTNIETSNTTTVKSGGDINLTAPNVNVSNNLKVGSKITTNAISSATTVQAPGITGPCGASH